MTLHVDAQRIADALEKIEEHLRPQVIHLDLETDAFPGDAGASTWGVGLKVPKTKVYHAHTPLPDLASVRTDGDTLSVGHPFAEGDTIRCVDAGVNVHLTKDKLYFVEQLFPSGVLTLADDNQQRYYFNSRFEKHAPVTPEFPQRCDGKEQHAFEAWAASQGHDMTEHPLHYLFLNPKTDAAREAWAAAIAYCRKSMGLTV